MTDIAIVEDERFEADKLSGYVGRFAGERGKDLRVSVFDNGLDFLDSMRRTTYGVVMLDIQMPMIDGISVARRLREQDRTVVLMFVTNMVQYAVEGYDVEAMAFIVKPVSYSDLAFKLEKALFIAERNTHDSITITSGSLIKRLYIADISYIESIKHSMIWHTAGGDFTVWNRSMADAEREMVKYGFARCNSGYLVNLGKVDNVIGDSVTVGDAVLPISRGRRRMFLEALASFGGGYDKWRR